MEIKCVQCGELQENAYFIRSPETSEYVLIDPGDGLAELENVICQDQINLGAILLTHGHFDHTLSAGILAQRYGIPIYIHGNDLEMLEDPYLSAYSFAAANLPVPTGFGAEPYPEQNNSMSVCGMNLRLLHTPGHTPGSVCLYFEKENILFSGDTLFAMGYGRTDLPGGNGKELVESLRLLFSHPEETKVYPGHGRETTIGREKMVFRGL